MWLYFVCFFGGFLNTDFKLSVMNKNHPLSTNTFLQNNCYKLGFFGIRVRGYNSMGGWKLKKKKNSKINIDVSPLKCKIILIKKCIILNINILFQLRCLKGQWQTYIHNYINTDMETYVHNQKTRQF